MCVCVLYLSSVQAKLVEEFDRDTCLFHILPAGPGKHRGEDIKPLKYTRYNIL